MGSTEEKLANGLTKVYYRLKPFLPRSLRWTLRRHRARHIRANHLEDWPILNEAGQPPEDWRGWPDGKKFAFVLTHDVESWEGVERVRTLVALEEKYGFRSSYNFIPEGDYSVPGELRSWISEKGFEVGVHDLNHNGRLYESRSSFARKAQKINAYLREWGASGFRSGFMLRRLDWLHDLDAAYDASTFDTDPFEPQPEGCHTIFPYMVSRTDGNGDAGYVELPYTLPQDSTLFLLLEEESPEIWLSKLDWIAKHGGMALVNVHPDYINFEGKTVESGYGYPVEMVETLLRHVRDRYGDECWNPLARELADWFRQQESQPVKETNYSPPTSSNL